MFRFWAQVFNKHLLEEIEYFKTQYEHERARAEAAIDELLRTRIQSGPVTISTPRETLKSESIVEKLLRDTEFTQVGETE